jgi:cell division protease FtsH
MVCEWGMSNRLGPVHYGRGEEAIFLGREMTTSQEYSEQTAGIIDEEVHKIVMTEYVRTRGLIETNLAALTGLAENLLEIEVLNGEQVDAILQKYGIKGEVQSSPSFSE